YCSHFLCVHLRASFHLVACAQIIEDQLFFKPVMCVQLGIPSCERTAHSILFNGRVPIARFRTSPPPKSSSQTPRDRSSHAGTLLQGRKICDFIVFTTIVPLRHDSC